MQSKKEVEEMMENIEIKGDRHQKMEKNKEIITENS